MSQKVRIALIDAEDRLRPVDPARALLIAAGMKEEGQKSPIEIRPDRRKKGRFVLVTGGHRLLAAQQLGWEEIEADILDLDDDKAKLREINENLYRAELTELDRAVFIAEKKRLYEKLNPAAKHGGDRRSDQAAIFGDLMPRFTAELQERLGYSERTLQRVIARAKIAPDVRAMLAGTAIADTGSELDALVKLPPEVQRQAVSLLLDEEAEDRPRNVAAAAAIVRGTRPAAPTPDEAALKALLTAWDRAPKGVRRRFIDQLVAQGALAERTVPA
ncbi:ParB N-terminal domain-containing protein [Xanthobacter sp. KR7-225]|uniref:ParB N-terminal domain-containing protein n=1 Tax=Xanthobacter sp. KR7-225 TaxID=3156613 RepID=UPI0032B3689D